MLSEWFFEWLCKWANYRERLIEEINKTKTLTFYNYRFDTYYERDPQCVVHFISFLLTTYFLIVSIVKANNRLELAVLSIVFLSFALFVEIVFGFLVEKKFNFMFFPINFVLLRTLFNTIYFAFIITSIKGLPFAIITILYHFYKYSLTFLELSEIITKQMPLALGVIGLFIVLRFYSDFSLLYKHIYRYKEDILTMGTEFYNDKKISEKYKIYKLPKVSYFDKYNPDDICEKLYGKIDEEYRERFLHKSPAGFYKVIDGAEKEKEKIKKLKINPNERIAREI